MQLDRDEEALRLKQVFKLKPRSRSAPVQQCDYTRRAVYD